MPTITANDETAAANANATRVALVTGSSRGIGAATARELASRGYNVILTCIHGLDAAREVAAGIEREFKVRTAVIAADLAKESEVRRLAAEALSAFGCVDVLVNNAGIALYGDFTEKTIAGWEQSMQVNAYAPFILTQVIGAEMARAGYGKIVNIATIDVMTTYNAESAEYDASKAALISLTKTASLALQPHVNVNCVCPGWVATDMNKELPQELLDYQASKTCKGRMARPEEVAKLVTFLASDDAEFIDGEVIKIDGGYKLM